MVNMRLSRGSGFHLCANSVISSSELAVMIHGCKEDLLMGLAGADSLSPDSVFLPGDCADNGVGFKREKRTR